MMVDRKMIFFVAGLFIVLGIYLILILINHFFCVFSSFGYNSARS
jgi:hypothetical protein